MIGRKRSDEDQFIVVACDGIWDCMSNDDCINYITENTNQTLLTETNCHIPIEDMFESIIAPNTAEAAGTDNMTAILIWFPQN